MKGLAASHSCSEPSQRQRQSWHRDATDAARASAGRDDAGAGAVAIGRGDRGVAVDGGGSFIRTIPSLSRAARGGAPRCRFALGAVLALQWPRESPPPNTIRIRVAGDVVRTLQLLIPPNLCESQDA